MSTMPSRNCSLTNSSTCSTLGTKANAIFAPSSTKSTDKRLGGIHVYAASPLSGDAVDSLADNGIYIQVQLLYGNVMYTSPSGKRPDVSTPEPGSFHNDDRSLYSVNYAPTTPRADCCVQPIL
jgi:hypothetical protein